MHKHMFALGRSMQKRLPQRSKGVVAPDCSSRGFTLVELMVAVVIVGILSAVAISSYRSSVLKSNRQAAKTALLDIAAREEKFFSLNNAYSSTITDLYPGTTMTWSINAPLSGTALYTIAAPVVVAATTSATTTTPATFTITAVPTGTQANDKCGNFVLNSVGQQTVSGTATSCW